MSNHYHIVLHISFEAATNIFTQAVHARWQVLFKGSQLSTRYLRSDDLCDAERLLIEELADKRRARLSA